MIKLCVGRAKQVRNQQPKRPNALRVRPGKRQQEERKHARPTAKQDSRKTASNALNAKQVSNQQQARPNARRARPGKCPWRASRGASTRAVSACTRTARSASTAGVANSRPAGPPSVPTRRANPTRFRIFRLPASARRPACRVQCSTPLRLSQRAELQLLLSARRMRPIK